MTAYINKKISFMKDKSCLLLCRAGQEEGPTNLHVDICSGGAGRCLDRSAWPQEAVHLLLLVPVLLLPHLHNHNSSPQKAIHRKTGVMLTLLRLCSIAMPV